MKLSEQDFNEFKTWLKSHLKFGKVTIEFTKADGSLRVMNCTLRPDMLPTMPEHDEKSKPRKINEDVLPVFDIDQCAWRSFRWDSIKQVTFTLGED